VKCNLCGDKIESLGKITAHKKDKHPEVYQAMLANLHKPRGGKQHKKAKGKSVATPPATGGDGHGTSGTVSAFPLSDFNIGPPEPVTIKSSLLWLAQKASIRYFGWPEMSIEDFLESYLYYTMEMLDVHLFAMASGEELRKLQKGGNHGENRQSSIGAELAKA
jgi:hypothetical protein